MSHLLDDITIRIYGENLTLKYSQWCEMWADMRPDCPNAQRINARLVRSQEQVVGDMEADRQAARDGYNPNW